MSSSSERSAAWLSREPRFESSALYSLVAGLYVRTYEDLLAPHWAVPDGPRPAERMDVTRFVRSVAAERSHVLVALPAPATVEASDAELTTEATRTVAIVPAGTDWIPSVRIQAPHGDAVRSVDSYRNRRSRARVTMTAWLKAIGSRAMRPFDRLRTWWRVRRLRG